MDDLANVCAAAKERTHRSAPFSKPPLTFNFLERSTSSGRKSAALPTKMAAEKSGQAVSSLTVAMRVPTLTAMHR